MSGLEVPERAAVRGLEGLHRQGTYLKDHGTVYNKSYTYNL